MKEFQWDPVKNERLKKVRGVSFDEILKSRFIKKKNHPQRTHQDMLLFERGGYIWVVPCVESEDALFLKTLFPSRKYTKLYRKGLLS